MTKSENDERRWCLHHGLNEATSKPEGASTTGVQEQKIRHSGFVIHWSFGFRHSDFPLKRAKVASRALREYNIACRIGARRTERGTRTDRAG